MNSRLPVSSYSPANRNYSYDFDFQTPSKSERPSCGHKLIVLAASFACSADRVDIVQHAMSEFKILVGGNLYGAEEAGARGPACLYLFFR
jgi:hypothetical protein